MGDYKGADVDVNKLVRLFELTERDLLKEINRALLKGNNMDYLNAMLVNCRAILAKLRSGSKDWSDEAIPKVYQSSMEYVDKSLKKLGLETVAGFGTIHIDAMKVLAEATFSRFEDVTQTIGRRVMDIYRTMALETTRASIAGSKSYQTVGKNLREELADRGVTGFKDRLGREWNMRTYSKMVARTTTMEAHIQGTCNRLSENGHDLVKVTDHANECDKCRPWENEILSISGDDSEHTSLATARAKGLFHPNCRHDVALEFDLDAEIAKLKRDIKN